MSVTFNIEAIPTGAFTAECFATATVLSGETYDAILATIVEHKAACEECGHYGIYSQAVCDIDDDGVNLSEANATAVLRMLGLSGYEDEDLCGGATGQEFYAAAVLAQVALQDDSGVAPADLTAPGRVRFVDCGVRPGYFTDVLGRLADLGAEAARLGRDVHWS